MSFFIADKDFFIAGICVMMSLAFYLSACKRLYILVTGAVMRMFRNLTDQISFPVIASVLSRMRMLFQAAIQFLRHCIAAVIMVMTFAFFPAAYESGFISAFVVLVFFNSACRRFFERNRR